MNMRGAAKVKDCYFFRSLLATLAVCLLLFVVMAAFVFFTGVAGFFAIAAIILILMAYFYS